MSDISQEVYKHIRRIQFETVRLAEDMMAGAYHSAFKGKGMEFEEVREYVPGDDVRDIDWNVTARARSPHVKVYREERELTVMLMVDISSSTRFGSGLKSKKEMIAEVGALLAFTVTINSDKVGLVLFSDHVEKYVSPKKGLRHVLRIIRELLVHEPEGHGTDLSAALNFMMQVQKRPAVCFLISDFLCEEHLVPLSIAAKHHDLIAVMVNDAVEGKPVDLGLVSLEDLESGLLQTVDTDSMEWREHFSAFAEKRVEEWRGVMKRVGAGFIFMRTDQSYVDALTKFFRLRRIRH